MARELDDAILHLRTNELDIGTWMLKTEGDAEAVLAMDATLLRQRATLAGARDHRLAAPHLRPPGRLFALAVRADRAGSCFAGTLLELALAADRSYMLALPDMPERAPKIALSEMNFGLLPMVTGQSRLARRFYDDEAPIAAARAAVGGPLDADAGAGARPGHRRLPTTSTGPTRSASPSKSAPACRPMR